MQIAVTFRHMEADEGIKNYVKEKVERLEKYVVNPREVHVVLSAEKFRHTAEITVVGNGMTLNSQGKNSDPYAAIDQMVERMERQVRERRERTRRKRSNPSSARPPTRVAGRAFEEKDGVDILSGIQRRQISTKPMSLEEAVAQISLSEEDFLIFINSDSGQMNVLRRSEGGGYEWVEPRSE